MTELNPSGATPNMDITAIFTDEQAEALAQFLKRVGLSDYRALAISDEEAYAMLHAGDAIRRALAEAGHSPR